MGVLKGKNEGKWALQIPLSMKITAIFNPEEFYSGVSMTSCN